MLPQNRYLAKPPRNKRNRPGTGELLTYKNNNLCSPSKMSISYLTSMFSFIREFREGEVEGFCVPSGSQREGLTWLFYVIYI